MAAAGFMFYMIASRPRLALLSKAMRCPAVIAGLPVLLLPRGGWWLVVGSPQRSTTSQAPT